MTDTQTLLTVEPTPTASIRISAPPKLSSGSHVPVNMTLTDRIGNVVVETARFEVNVSFDEGRRVVESTTIAKQVAADHGMSSTVTSGIELPPDTPPTIAGIDVTATVTIDTNHGSARERVFLTVGLSETFRAAFEAAVEAGLSLRRVACRVTEQTGAFVSEYTFDATALRDSPDRLRLFLSTRADGLMAAVAAGNSGPVPQSWQPIEQQSVRSSIERMLPVAADH